MLGVALVVMVVVIIVMIMEVLLVIVVDRVGEYALVGDIAIIKVINYSPLSFTVPSLWQLLKSNVLYPWKYYT